MAKLATLVLAAFVMLSAHAQSPDPALLTEILKIKAIDNHSHPPALVADGETDDDYDALPCDRLEPTQPTLAGRPENPMFLAAWKALYGYKYDDRTDAHIRELMEAKKRVRREQGDHFPNWVLDQSGIEIELANRVAMGRGLMPRRFLWVPFDDALMLPLNNQSLASETPDRRFFYAREEKLLKRYLADLKLKELPATLEEYTAKVVLPTLQRQKESGAVAVKFEAAYLRALDFQAVPLAQASPIYSRYVRGGIPSKADYTTLQDYLFKFIAREAGPMQLPVHIHTGSGCGSYFKLSGADPLLLDSMLNDAELRKTNFVLIHGGAGPFTKQTAFLLSKPNVYADFSEQTWLLSTRELGQVIRNWLEWYPEKVMFGTDLFPGSREIDWEEIGWQTTRESREALAIALTGMMQDQQITRERAMELARMVLRENAVRLYHFPAH